MVRSKALRSVAVTVGLGLVLMIAVSVIVPRTNLAQRLADWAEQETGAEISLGSLRTSWGGGLSLVLHDGELQGVGQDLVQRQGFGADLGPYEITFAELSCKLSFLPLLHGDFEVKSVHIVGPLAAVELSGDSIVLRNYDLNLTQVKLPKEGAINGADLAFELALSCAHYSGQGAEWSDVSLVGEWMANQLHLPDVRGHLGLGELGAALVLDFRGAGPGEISGSVRWQDMAATELLAPYLPDLAAKLSCQLTGEMAGSMSLAGRRERRESLVLEISISGGEGVLDARDWLGAARPYLGDRQDLQVIAFDQLSHRGKVAEGRYQIENLLIEGVDTSWHAAGWVEFEHELQVGVDLKLPVGFTPELGSMAFLAEMLRDREGRINVAATVTGKTSAPVVAADIQRMMQRR